MKILLFSLLITVALLIGSQSFAQTGVAINNTGADAAGSAMLDVSSLTKGVLIPRMTAVQRAAIISPAKGLLVYQDDVTEGFYYYDGTAWTRLASGTYIETDPVVKAINGVVKSNGSTILAAVAGTDYLSPATGWSMTGNTGTTPGINFIGTPDDKALVFKVNNQKAGEISSGTNTSYGYQALTSNTTGIYNTANGSQTLKSNTTGTYNTANGYYALFSNTEGSNNTANGHYALFLNTTGKYNIASGHYALANNTTGDYNTAVGYWALKSNTTGYGNTAYGSKAGHITGGSNFNQTSYNSVYLGADTKAFADAQNNEIVIGYNATGAGSNTVTLGNTDITTTVLRGNVSAKRYVLTQPSAITSATTTTIDLSLGNVFQVNLQTNIAMLSLTNPAVGTYLVKFTQDATGGRTVAFPAAWKWSGGTAPIVTATAAKTDIVTLIWDGTTYYAAIVQNF
jgi:hypothetical protein